MVPMTDPRLAVIVLAAGQGTRMKSSRAKVLHPLAGVPMIGHVLATARELSAAHVIVVVRHERDAVSAAVLDLMPDATVVDRGSHRPPGDHSARQTPGLHPSRCGRPRAGRQSPTPPEPPARRR